MQQPSTLQPNVPRPLLAGAASQVGNVNLPISQPGLISAQPGQQKPLFTSKPNTTQPQTSLPQNLPMSGQTVTLAQQPFNTMQQQTIQRFPNQANPGLRMGMTPSSMPSSIGGPRMTMGQRMPTSMAGNQPPSTTLPMTTGVSVSIGQTTVSGASTLVSTSQSIPGQIGGQIVTSGTQMITSGGQIMTSSGQMVTSGGQMVSSAGQIMTSGGQIMTSGGQIVSSGGQMVTSGGQIMTSGGQMITSGGQLVTAGGQMINSGGQQPVPTSGMPQQVRPQLQQQQMMTRPGMPPGGATGMMPGGQQLVRIQGGQQVTLQPGQQQVTIQGQQMRMQNPQQQIGIRPGQGHPAILQQHEQIRMQQQGQQQPGPGGQIMQQQHQISQGQIIQGGQQQQGPGMMQQAGQQVNNTFKAYKKI